MSDLLVIGIAFACFVAGYEVGRMYCRGRQAKQDTVHTITLQLPAGHASITLKPKVIHALLDQQGLIAVPKGADFRPRADETCS